LSRTLIRFASLEANKWVYIEENDTAKLLTLRLLGGVQSGAEHAKGDGEPSNAFPSGPNSTKTGFIYKAL
jgi:hypothetical protein